MLLGMLKPLLPKLERFLKNHEDLEENEFATITMNIFNGEFAIQIVAVSREPNADGNHEITRVLQDVNPKEL